MTTTDPTEHALVERLRAEARFQGAYPLRRHIVALLDKAAAALEDLTRENERLRAHAEFYREAMREANATAHAENEYARLNGKCDLLEWENKGLRLQIEGLNEACKRHADDKKDLRAELRRLSEN